MKTKQNNKLFFFSWVSLDAIYESFESSTMLFPHLQLVVVHFLLIYTTKKK